MSSFMNDDFKFIVRNIMSEYLNESILEGFTQLFSSSIALSRILSGENSKMGVRFYSLLSFYNEKFLVII